VPVIFMTGLSETENIVEGLESGGVDYVTKPIILDELFARIRVHLANARTAQSARDALDTAGRTLLASDREGDVLWCTPQAVKLIEEAIPDWDGATLPEPLRTWLRVVNGPQSTMPAPPTIPVDGKRRLHFSLLSSTSESEVLFRIAIDGADAQVAILRRLYAVTGREAEVLLWVAQGKSNRDIGEILGLSPRTVNKHLEQIYQKLGVENRASAAIAAVKALDDH
jgi:DNA-binding NarL/FixJ family response regulator